MSSVAQKTTNTLPAEIKNFSADMKAMLAGDNTGVGLKYLYQSWNEILEDDSYYVDREDRTLLKAALPALKKDVGLNRTVLELGCGGSDKGVSLARDFNAESYVPVDFWEENARASARYAGRISNQFLCLDFMKTSFNWRQFDKPIVLLVGTTISNLVADARHVKSKDVLRGVLQKISDIAGPGGDIIITYDTSRASEDVYNTPAHIDFRKRIFDIANEYIPFTKIDKSAFNAPAVWDGDNNLLSYFLTPKEDQTFPLNGTATTVHKGQKVIEGKSYKYPEQMFDDVCEEVGIQSRLTDRDEHMVLQHLRCPR